ncbi:hypothetical protein NQ317_007223 [Molorchus minor]|uniref:Uncharacterized protein n=1 Tax=Molorchus minor TaxID=1323400 RepID=A0ABQ9J062_9CUCU|nr:hypothetical protein NQ317_007223 [Molorchus minor]
MEDGGKGYIKLPMEDISFTEPQTVKVDDSKEIALAYENIDDKESINKIKDTVNKKEEVKDISNKSNDKDCEDIMEALDRAIDNKDEKEAQGEIKETIEIDSDNDSDNGIHLDVVMEEIVSTGDSLDVECIGEQEDISKEDIEEIIPGKNFEIADSQQGHLADELLELLREVEVPQEAKDASNNITSVTTEKCEVKKADEILKMLEEESISDISDVDTSDWNTNLSSSDLEWIDDISNTGYENNIKDTLKCYIPLERIQIDKEEIVKVNRNLNDSVDRLCDISSLLTKKKVHLLSGQTRQI